MKRVAFGLKAALGLSLLGACESPNLPCETCTSQGGGGADALGGGGGGAAQIDCPASGVFHGPWSLRPGETTGVIRWDACKPMAAEITIEPEQGGDSLTVTGSQTPAAVTTYYDLFDVPPDLPGTYYTTEVALEGLSPGVCYKYAIVADPTHRGRFCTAKPAGQSFGFMAVGDTNPAIGPTEAIVDIALMRSPDFVVHLGDIQYYSSIFDSWSQWFISMQPMLSGAAFMPAIGNHESENETEYADYYDRLFAGAGFDGDADRKYYRFHSGGVWFFALDSEQDLAPNSPQGIWLAQSLESAAAAPGFRGSVVYMHRPLITVGDSASDPGLRSLLEPLFLEHGVVMVLAGHMHGYERFDTGSLTYVTSAGGGGLLGNVDENVEARPEEAALRVASGAWFHVVYFEVGPTSIDATTIDETGAALDTFSVPLPQAQNR